MKIAIGILCMFLISVCHGQTTVLIPPPPSLPPPPNGASLADFLSQAHESIKQHGELAGIGNEMEKLTQAVMAKQASLKPGEKATIVIVTKNTNIGSGGSFLGIEEPAKAGQKGLGIEAPPGSVAVRSQEFVIQGPYDLRTEWQKQYDEARMKEAAENLKKAADDKKKADESAAAAAAEKKQADEAAANAAAAKKKADEAAAKAAAEKRKADAAAARAERDAERRGREVQRNIENERRNYRRGGGNFRAPA